MATSKPSKSKMLDPFRRLKLEHLLYQQILPKAKETLEANKECTQLWKDEFTVPTQRARRVLKRHTMEYLKQSDFCLTHLLQGVPKDDAKYIQYKFFQSLTYSYFIDTYHMLRNFVEEERYIRQLYETFLELGSYYKFFYIFLIDTINRMAEFCGRTKPEDIKKHCAEAEYYYHEYRRGPAKKIPYTEEYFIDRYDRIKPHYKDLVKASNLIEFVHICTLRVYYNYYRDFDRSIDKMRRYGLMILQSELTIRPPMLDKAQWASLASDLGVQLLVERNDVRQAQYLLVSASLLYQEHEEELMDDDIALRIEDEEDTTWHEARLQISWAIFGLHIIENSFLRFAYASAGDREVPEWLKSFGGTHKVVQFEALVGKEWDVPHLSEPIPAKLCGSLKEVSKVFRQVKRLLRLAKICLEKHERDTIKFELIQRHYKWLRMLFRFVLQKVDDAKAMEKFCGKFIVMIEHRK